MRKIIIYFLISAASLVLPAKETGAEEDKYAQVMREMAKIHYTRARSYYRNAEYIKAKIELREVLRLAPGHQGALWYLDCVERALDSQKEACGSRQAKLAKLEREDRLSEVQVALSAAQEIEVDERDAERDEIINELYRKGKDYFSRGLYAKAIACFEKVIKLAGKY
ncbi:MAG: tetratricopeptide repeat protein [Candidatus Omnitrophota bacterium]|nr:MAG: tetratricopeptide repeat protein [Candidatus Omnitrophota bacterium]